MTCLIKSKKGPRILGCSVYKVSGMPYRGARIFLLVDLRDFFFSDLGSEG